MSSKHIFTAAAVALLALVVRPPSVGATVTRIEILKVEPKQLPPGSTGAPGPASSPGTPSLPGSPGSPSSPNSPNLPNSPNVGAGPYEHIFGLIHGELDPNDPKNAIITDIKLAPRNARGKVE